jgi:hypothetical protein
MRDVRHRAAERQRTASTMLLAQSRGMGDAGPRHEGHHLDDLMRKAGI